MTQAGEVFDITIIGAGPAGLFGAFYAGLRELKTKIVEALPEPGGQLAVLYPEKYIYDVPGHPKVLAKDLVKMLMEQATQWNPTLCLGERVLGLERADGVWQVKTTSNAHLSKTVLIAAGVGAFSPNKVKCESIDRFEGQGVYYFTKDKTMFRGKRLLIVGGGDSAVDWALNLKDYARRVTLIHRRDNFRAHPASVTELMNSNVEVRLYHELRKVEGDGRLRGAVIFDNRSGQEEKLDVDAILLNLGFKADLGPIKTWGAALQGTRYIKVNARMETSLPGVYAAGDLAAQEGAEPINLIALGFSQATVAVNMAATYINPQCKVFPGHSSEKQF
jgi:thioredoxin reductase